tara:strand:- start:49750 stop:50307 length:558 start_codon:yes stop_codon:yes gene_type:complete
MMRALTLTVLFLSFISTSAWADVAADRSSIQSMKEKTLTRLYSEEPNARKEIENAEGYAVFSSGGVNLVLFSAAYGSGIAHDNKSGGDTYMKMASGGVGIGLGIKDYRLVFVFKTRKAFNQFVTYGWDLSGQADAAVKAGTEGEELSEAANIMPGMKVYQLTESGLALQATIQGTKYWKNSNLND